MKLFLLILISFLLLSCGDSPQPELYFSLLCPICKYNKQNSYVLHKCKDYILANCVGEDCNISKRYDYFECSKGHKWVEIHRLDKEQSGYIKLLDKNKEYCK